jgi:hypothetical protein
MYIGPTHSASSERIIQTPERNRYLFLFVVFVRRPVDTVDTGEPCLYVSSEVTQVGQPPALGIFDEDGHTILQNEEGDWSDFAAFTKKALGLANGRLGTCMVEFERKEWRYCSVSGKSEDALRDWTLQGWSVVNSSVGSDGNRWFLLKRPKVATPTSTA